MRLAYAAEECGDKAGMIMAINYSAPRETYVRLTQMIGGKPTAQGKYWQELLGQVGGAHPSPDAGLTETEKAATSAAFQGCGLLL